MAKRCFLTVNNQRLTIIIEGRQEVFHLDGYSMLKEFVAKYKLKGANCTSYLSPQDFQLLKTKKPNVAQREMIETLKWQEQAKFSQAAEMLVLDYLDIPLADQADQVFVTAVDRAFLERHQDALEAAGLNSQNISISPLAYCPYIKRYLKNYQLIAWLNLFEDSQSINAYYNGELIESLRLPLSTNSSVAEQCGLLTRIYEEKLQTYTDNFCWLVNSFDEKKRDEIKSALPGNVIATPVLESDWQALFKESWSLSDSDSLYGALANA